MGGSGLHSMISLRVGATTKVRRQGEVRNNSESKYVLVAFPLSSFDDIAQRRLQPILVYPKTTFLSEWHVRCTGNDLEVCWLQVSFQSAHIDDTALRTKHSGAGCKRACSLQRILDRKSWVRSRMRKSNEPPIWKRQCQQRAIQCLMHTCETLNCNKVCVMLRSLNVVCKSEGVRVCAMFVLHVVHGQVK